MIYLKDHNAILDLIAGVDFTDVATDRKTQLAVHFEGMLAANRPPAYAVLTKALPNREAAFVMAMFTDVPTVPPPPAEPANGNGFTGNITSVGDGGPTSLESLSTAGLALPSLRTFYVAAADELQTWLLLAGTLATQAGAIQRPADYSAGTNTRIWVRKAF